MAFLIRIKEQRKLCVQSLTHPFPILYNLIRSHPGAQLLCQSFQLDSVSIIPA